MKLIIQIPCYNEEKTLPLTYIDLPKEIEGIDEIETLIINDGSTDRTVDIAKELGINHIISFKRNKGLAKAFESGIYKCLELGADIIVNTDGDNQYYGGDIPKLVKPIVEEKADVVVGDRQTKNVKHFSAYKKILQKVGSKVVRRLSGTKINDAVSGFRAYSRESAMKINILTEFSYTIENLIQLGHLKERIVSVPVKTNKKLRSSRLFKNIPSFIIAQLTTIIRAYSNYEALRFFTFFGLLLILPGIIGFARFLYYFFTVGGEGHIQSLIFSTAFLNIGFLIIFIGIVANLIGTNRKLSEKILQFLKEDKWEKKK
ncbi:MAG: glycosyltransferase family 2 protein [Bacteroidales bacterium]|nr:glycosyltransferase family 2 protein [Bacteroidales bacterium]